MPTNKKPSITKQALALLNGPDFFGQVRGAVERCGLVGEVKNAQAIYVTATSSVLTRPLNALVKGPSSAGKNFLVEHVLSLFPDTAIVVITSSSRTALNYSGTTLRNRILYLQETNDSMRELESVRNLISERQLIRTVTVREGGQWIQRKFVAEGPAAVISTTTRDQLEVDEETRHVSLWVDDSPEQSRRVIKRQLSPFPALSKDETAVWHKVYNLMSKRSAVPVEFPGWFEDMADKVYSNDIRVRRYFPSFLEAVRTIAIIRSFQKYPDDYATGESISASFVDYALAAYIFDELFVESLRRAEDECMETARTVEKIASTRNGEPVDADQLAKYSGISYDKACAKLRSALDAGVIVQATKPAKNNSKRYLPAKAFTFVPDPEMVAQSLEFKKPMSFIHPVTGKKLTFGGK